MSGSKQTALSALEKIRRQRRGEAKASEQYEVKDENAEIYQTVTEEDYQKLKQTRRAQEWIDGEGYSDDGEEWWVSNSEDDDEEEDRAASRREKRRKEGDRETKKAKKPRNNALAAAAAVAAASAEAQGMRSLVQHFSAKSVESNAKQEHSMLTQRYVESLQSVDKLFGDDDEEDGESAAGGAGGFRAVGGGERRPSPDADSRAGRAKTARPPVSFSLEREGARKSAGAEADQGASMFSSYAPSSFLAQFGVGRAAERAPGLQGALGAAYVSAGSAPAVPGGLGARSRLSAQREEFRETCGLVAEQEKGANGLSRADAAAGNRERGAGGEGEAQGAGGAAGEEAFFECEEDEGDEEERAAQGEEAGDNADQTLFRATGEYEASGPVVPKKGLTLFMKDDEEDEKAETQTAKGGAGDSQRENGGASMSGGDAQAGGKQLPVCEDGTLPFYFLDAWEEAGTLYLFGKVWSAAAKLEKDGTEPKPLHAYRNFSPPQSCCIVVRDMMVPLFFRTREQVDVATPLEGGALDDADSQDRSGEHRDREAEPADGEGGGDSEARERELRRRLERRMEITKGFFKQDLPRLKQKYRWRKVAIKGVFRNYAFDAPDVPRGRDQTFVKVFVPASAPLLSPEDLEGETYTHVFGVGQSLIELLLVKRRIKGPCWLRIKNFSLPESALDHVSWCQHEVIIQSHKDVRLWNAFDKTTQTRHADGCPPPHPPLTVVSLAAKSVQVPSIAAGAHASETDRQLAMASFFVYRDANIEDQSAQPRLSLHNIFCGIRRVRTAGGATARVNAEGLPLQFYELCSKQGFGIFDAEKTLLLNFINRLAAADPDILVGHNIYGMDLELLGQRCAVHGLPVWHRLSRLKRPKHVKPRVNSSFSVGGRGEPGGFGASGLWGGRMLTVGRLVCDTYMQAHELLGHRVNYDLVPLMQDLFLAPALAVTDSASAKNWVTNLQRSIRALRPFPQPQELLELFQRREPQPLLVCLQMCVQETFMAVVLCWRLNCLPLTRELTTIGGNLWARSLQNQRAERNSFLLLHEFHREKFICPDSEDPYSRGAQNKRGRAGRGAGGAVPVKEEEVWGDEEAPGPREAEEENEGPREGDERSGSTRAKAAYTGGLVLEPRVGLYDTFVILLDFNSLYPSIIQEFNVCFSTVKRPMRRRRRLQGNGGTRSALEDGEAREEDGNRAHAAEEDVQGILPTPGLLPRVLRQLVQKRRAVKASMKGETNPVKRATQEIKQLAFKLTANSIYGCLGFSRSRFYAKELAAFITQQGRNILMATKDKVERGLRLEVVYGDTDSIMINTGLHDDGGQGKTFAAAVRLGEQVKAEINKNYKKLEIDLEAVFRRLLLLKKKKYACCIVLDYAKRQYNLEQKGLDIVRRDWAKLTKAVGNQLLQIMFRVGPEKPSALANAPAAGAEGAPAAAAGPETEKGEGADADAMDTVVEELHAKLREVGKQMRAGRVPLEFFVITKALTKPPHMYARGAGGAVMHPHVQVALRMQARGLSVKPGNEIPFVICTEASARAFLESREPAPERADKPGDATETGSSEQAPGGGAGAKDRRAGGTGPLSPAERAFHPREVAANTALEIDVGYYLEQQLLPPIQRMCAYVEGTSAARLAECLGLDGSKHARVDGGLARQGDGDDADDSREAREKAGEERIMALISKSEEKYKMYKLPINLPCVACKAVIPGKDVLQFMRCPACTRWVAPSMLRNFVRLTLAALQSKFSRPCFRCSSCSERFDRLPPPSGFASGRGSRFVCPRCEEGELREELTAHQLYMYLDEVQFYLSGDLTSQQQLLVEREKDRNPEKAALLMQRCRRGGVGPAHPPAAGGASSSSKDTWLIPVGVDPNLVTKVLEEGRGKPPSFRERVDIRDGLETAYQRVREAEVPPIKRGVELRYPHAVAAYIYLEKMKQGAAWVDMQQEREKLQKMVSAVLEQNAYRMIELRNVLSVMKVSVPLDPAKRRWQILRCLNRVKARETERKAWGVELRHRGSSLASLLDKSSTLKEEEKLFGHQKLHSSLTCRVSDIVVKREGTAE
ncbi:hypothetical protein BESB_007080 [Besnoitia besnoiti]|uniref:DNA-directed DNA polymerase n=1 Tax=Besnoitia besnoiti TaxID=94643 RepID=A0A2A9MQA4_BESBE|nr:hypothetical protein BESB_007080 [Besnoitia besnoiti]PFH38367.1 hypothetical protein BESB_007080 [Besnoitia besnoiti]